MGFNVDSTATPLYSHELSLKGTTMSWTLFNLKSLPHQYFVLHSHRPHLTNLEIWEI